MSDRLVRPPAMAPALARACRFVEANGTPLARARLSFLLAAAPPGAVEASLAPWRCPDGGYHPLEGPACEGGAATLGGTLGALEVFDEAGVRSGPQIEAAVAWLARAQAADGAWRVAPAEACAPADADPVYLTGMLAGHLAKLRCGSPRTLARAEEFLAARFTPALVETGDWRALAAYAHVCTNGAFALADEALQWCGRALEKGFRSGRLDASDVARTLLLCDVSSLPGGRVDAGEVALALLGAQDGDGGFGGGRQETHDRVERTLLVVRALARFGAPR